MPRNTPKPAPAPDERWLTQAQLADRWQIPVDTVRDWRLRRYGPQAVKLGTGRGGAVRYRLSEVERWEREREKATAGRAS